MPLIDDDDDVVKEPIQKKSGVKAMTDEKGINIEHHDHDYHPHAGYHHKDYAAVGVGWGILAFIAFIVIIWAVWAGHHRSSDNHVRDIDKHHEALRGIDKLGYELGYTRKQLNDMQCMEDKILQKEEKIYDRMCYEQETMLRFGTPYGEHTQRLCTAPPAHCGEHRNNRHGGVINGSQLSDTNTFAYDHSVL